MHSNISDAGSGLKVFLMSQEIETEDTITKSEKMLGFAERIAMGEANGDFIYCLEENKFYVYKEGAWQQIFEYDFLSIISKHLNKINKYPVAQRKQILENYKIIRNVKLDIFNKMSLINLENCMFNPIGINTIEHKKEYYSTIRIPYKYEPEAICSLWIKTLMEIFEADANKITILQEFFGYCLTRDTKQHKALLLLGESRSGKSTILQTLRGVIGDKNCSSVPLKYLSNPQYTPMLINKLVNIDTDVSAKAAEFEAEFKTITSGEPVSCNQKFIAAFDFMPFCKVVMAANIFPKITDHSSAFYKRLILLPCNKVFLDKEQNKDLPLQLKPEYPGILNWAVAGLKRLQARGTFEELNFMREAVEELENENNPVNIFFREHIEIEFDGYIEKSNLYENYIRWCKKTNNFKLSKERFASCVFKKFHKETPKSARLSDGTRPWVWRNLKLINELELKWNVDYEN